jgi:hypothetical protein
MIELGDPTSEAKTRNTGPSRGWLYDVGGNDSPIRIDGSKLPRIGKDQMLWIDIDLDKADRSINSGINSTSRISANPSGKKAPVRI